MQFVVGYLLPCPVDLLEDGDLVLEAADADDVAVAGVGPADAPDGALVSRLVRQYALNSLDFR